MPDFDAVFSFFSQGHPEALLSSHIRRETAVQNCEKSKNRRKSLCAPLPFAGAIELAGARAPSPNFRQRGHGGTTEFIGHLQLYEASLNFWDPNIRQHDIRATTFCKVTTSDSFYRIHHAPRHSEEPKGTKIVIIISMYICQCQAGIYLGPYNMSTVPSWQMVRAVTTQIVFKSSNAVLHFACTTIARSPICYARSTISMAISCLLK